MVSTISQEVSLAQIARFMHGCYEICYELSGPTTLSLLDISLYLFLGARFGGHVRDNNSTETTLQIRVGGGHDADIHGSDNG
jgi:hypothetical protein